MRSVLVRASSAVLLALFSGALAPCATAEDAPSKPEGEGDAPKNSRELTKGYVGVTWGLAQKLSADERKEREITVEKGMVIQHVMLDGPAMNAGVKVGDVPISLNGTPLPDGKDLATDDETFKKFMDERYKPVGEKIDPGQKVTLVVERAGKQLT